MQKKIITFILCMFCLSGAVMALEENRVEFKEVEKKDNFKLKWSVMNKLRKIKEYISKFKFRPSWKCYTRRIMALLTSSIDAMVFDPIVHDAIGWAKHTPGCWHSESDGSVKSAYASALHSEAWGTDTTKAFNVTQSQSIITNVTPSSSSGSLLLKRSTNTIFTLNFLAGNITVNGGATIDTYTAGTEITIQLIPDMVEETVVIYIDGSLLSKEDFATGEHCNTFDEVARSGTFTAVGNIKVSDTMDNLPIHFYDSLNEDTISDYTLGGDTNPTYDSTEKSIELRDVTNLANQTSIAYQDFSCPQDETTFKFTAKIGTNDSSTDGRLMDIRLRSKVDTDTYVAVYYNGANIFLENVVDGAVSGTGNTAIALGNTSHDFKIIIRLNEAHIYLFIDDVEYLDVTPTKLKRFFDGQVYFQSQHDAGEESEIFVKDLIVKDLPTVNAPRSTPPGLLTSALRPNVDGTFWDDLKGEWTSAGTISLVQDNGLYGNTINSNTINHNYHNVKLDFDGTVDLTKYHSLRVLIETDNVTNFDYLQAVSFNGSIYSQNNYASSRSVNAKHLITFAFSGFTNQSGLTNSIQLYFQVHYSALQTSNLKISDIQLLGGPEHDIRGQPLYSSSGIDDIDEWDLTDSTTVSPIWNAGPYYDLDDATNAINEICSMKRSINMNPNGVGHLHFEAEIMATDSSTDMYWVMEVRIDDNNRMYLAWEHNAGVPRLNYRTISGGNSSFSGTVATAKDNNSNTFDAYFHSTYGLALFMNDILVFSDYTITGTWTDWTASASIKFWTRHDAGERSDVHLHEVGFDRHPLNVHQYQSNELEELTDTLAPSGTDYMDGDWVGTASVNATGNPITNLKYIYENALVTTDSISYTPDSAIDLRRHDRVKVWLYGTNAGNYNITLQTSAGNNRTSSNIALTASKWTLVDIEDIIDASWGGSGAGTLDPSSVATILITNNSGGNSDTRIYGLQFLSTEYNNENFIPQTLEVHDNTIDAGHYGTFYMGKDEKARIYRLDLDGYAWLFESTLTILDVWGAGFSGTGTWQTKIGDLNVAMETSTFDNGITFWEGEWIFPLSCTFDHIKINGTCGVLAGYNNIGTIGDCTVITGVLELIEENIAHIYADATTSTASDLPVPNNWGLEARLEDGIMTDDVLCQFWRITLANGTQWDFDLAGTMKWQDFDVEGTGYFSVAAAVAFVTISVSFAGSKIADNTVGAGLFIESLGGGASWTHTVVEGSIVGYPKDDENYRDFINLADIINSEDKIN